MDLRAMLYLLGPFLQHVGDFSHGHLLELFLLEAQLLAGELDHVALFQGLPPPREYLLTFLLALDRLRHDIEMRLR